MPDTPDNTIPLRCPNCQYDVSQTLRDRITKCPECGRAIDWHSASQEINHITPGTRALLGALFLLPAIVTAAGVMIERFFFSGGVILLIALPLSALSPFFAAAYLEALRRERTAAWLGTGFSILLLNIVIILFSFLIISGVEDW